MNILLRIVNVVVVAAAVALAAAPALAQDAPLLPEPAADSLQTPSPARELPASARPPGFVGRPDLLQHASLAFAAGLGVGLASESSAAAAGVSLSLGAAKEWFDPRADRWDLAADLLGAALAALATGLLDR